MKIKVAYKILLILMLIPLLFVQMGCNRNTNLKRNGEYWILTEKNKLCSFSFEYSDYYRRAGPDYVFDFNPPFMYITLLSSKQLTTVIIPSGKDAITTATAEYVPAAIEITVAKAVDSVNTASNAKEEIESTLEDWGKWEDYELIARYPLKVAGIEGEFVEYFAANEHKCAVYFDYNGLIWSIEAKSRGDYDCTKIKADFDHILQTFKILE